jgi:hypothetical protein
MVAMPTNYTLTYNGTSTGHDECAASQNAITLVLVADGVVQSAGRDVDLLTIYYTQTNGQYASPPETFTISIVYSNGNAVKPIHDDGANNGSRIEIDHVVGCWTLIVHGPTNNNIKNYQLNTTGNTPPNKLKIRVKQQPSFSCTIGPFDDQFGSPL